MSSEVIYWIWAALLVLCAVTAWFATVFSLPGNWAMLGLVIVFALFYPEAEGRGVGWIAVAVVAGLAVVGEVIEFAAGAAGAAKEGGSRRGMLLAILGTVVGSIAGAIIGVPIPFVGPIIAAVGGGALGAFCGAYLGETWKGKTSAESIAVGKAALVGRLLGTMAKLIVGAMMVVVIALAVFVGWL
jgi:hypothetical protein